MLHRLAAQFINCPTLLSPASAETLIAVAGQRIGMDTDGFEASVGAKRDGAGQSYIVNRTAVVPIDGTIAHRMGSVNAMSGGRDYEAIAREVEAAMSDPNVDSVILDINSHGGAVAGAFDCRDKIMSYRGVKPMTAIARDTMCSAAYLIGSAADRIVAAQAARVGSIGVVMTHFDRSGELEQKGIKPTVIHSGARKADGSPYAALPEDVRERFQAEGDRAYAMFVSAVVEARGLSAEAVRATEAGTFDANEALALGLIDSIGTLDSALTEIAAAAPRDNSNRMSMEQEVPDMDEDKLRAEGASAERERISAILSLDAAAGRAKLAKHLALSTDMTPEAAAGILAVSAIEGVDGAAPVATAPVPAPAAPAPSAQAAAIDALVAQGAGIKSQMEDSAPEMSAEDKATAEAVADVRRFFGRK